MLAALALVFSCFAALVATNDPPGDGDWTPLTAEAATAEGGVTLRRLDDGSYLAEGENPDVTTYEFVFATQVKGITAIRVEALAHPSLPYGGPGRAEQGNFALSEVDLTVLPVTALGSDKPIGFKRAVADFSQSDGANFFLPRYAVDGKITPNEFYAPAGHLRHEARELVFEPKEPFGTTDGTRWKLRFHFRSSFPRHTAGCLRISITTRPETERLMPLPAAPEDSRISKATERGIDWLLLKQEPDGSWLGPDGTIYYGMTALGAYTLMQCGLRFDHPSVKAALAYLERVPVVRTYDAGCVLMAYKAMGENRPKERVKAITRFLLDTLGNGANQIGARWGYPFGHQNPAERLHWDLSNTQYAVLGLRAAAQCGEKVPTNVWERIAADTLELQGDYGEFCYRPGTKPTASMTLAGMTIVLICSEQLALVKGKEATVRRLQGALARAEGWLERNWSVEANVAPGDDGGSRRWYYYYLYGLERYGSISNKKVVGGHDWYAEASDAVLRRQAEDGSWATEYGEGDANTCFALIMLKRGSRTTGVEPRSRTSSDASDADKPTIASNGENPMLAWVRGLGAEAEQHLAAGGRIKSVQWKLNGQVVATVVPPPDADVRFERFLLHQPLRRNGIQELEATVQFVPVEGEASFECASHPLIVRVDNVEEPRHRETVRDHAAALTEIGDWDAVASSVDGGHDARHAVDGRNGTAWVCSELDREPWIKVSLRRAVAACAIKVVAAQPYLGGDGQYGRPQDIEVQVNGGKPFKVRLLDTTRAKQRIEFPKGGVKSIRIAIKSTYPGSDGSRRTGFKEIELLPVIAADDELRAASTSRVLVGPGSKAGDEWRYTSTKPGAGWEQPVFDDSAWPKSKGPFGDEKNAKAHAGPFEGGGLWIRKTFETDKEIAGRLLIQICHDDGAEVFLNGIQVGTLPSYSAGAYRGVIVPQDVAALVKPGPNTLAVHCNNIGGAAWLDVLLIEYLP